jgi:hypothetical protein
MMFSELLYNPLFPIACLATFMLGFIWGLTKQ